MCLDIIVHVCTVVLKSSTFSKLQFVLMYMCVCVHMLMCMPSCMCVDLVHLMCERNVVCSEHHSGLHTVKIGSHYATGTVNERKYSFTIQILFLKIYKSFSILMIGWMLANAGDATLELNLTQLQCHPNTCDTMLVLVSYCEPTYD